MPPLGGIPVNGTQMATMMMAFDSGMKSRGVTSGAAGCSTMLERVLEANGSNTGEVES